MSMLSLRRLIAQGAVAACGVSAALLGGGDFDRVGGHGVGGDGDEAHGDGGHGGGDASEAAPMSPGIEFRSDEELDKLESQLDEDARRIVRRLQPHFDQYCRAELRFLHSVCRLTRSQFRAVEKMVNSASREALLATGHTQSRMRQRAQRAEVQQPVLLPGSQRTLETALLIAADRALQPTQAAGYRREVAARRQFRREAGVKVIAAKLDRELRLSPEQRELVLQALRDAWDDRWHYSVQLLVNGDGVLPTLPNAELRAVLSDQQQAVFRSLPQYKNVEYAKGSHVTPISAIAVRTFVRRSLEEELDFAPEE